MKKLPYYPSDIMKIFQKFSVSHGELYSEFKSFFGDIDHNDFVDYLKVN